MTDSTPTETVMPGYGKLLSDIKKRVRSAQYEALRAVNREYAEVLR